MNLEKVIRSTRIGDDITTPAQMERAVQALAKKIVVVAQGENLFEITATSGRSDLSDAENAQLAQDIANRMIDIFREYNLGESRGEMRDTITFLDQQLAERSRQLEEAEQKRLAFESAAPRSCRREPRRFPPKSTPIATICAPCRPTLQPPRARSRRSTGNSPARRARSSPPTAAAPRPLWPRRSRTLRRCRLAG